MSENGEGNVEKPHMLNYQNRYKLNDQSKYIHLKFGKVFSVTSTQGRVVFTTTNTVDCNNKVQQINSLQNTRNVFNIIPL